MLNFQKIKEKGLSFRLVWDLFVVLIVITNLFLIIFDLTYLLARPFYFKYKREITKLYDPYLGIEPHRTTDTYVKYVDKLSLIERFENQDLLFSELESVAKIIGADLENLTKKTPNKNLEIFSEDLMRISNEANRDVRITAQMDLYRKISDSIKSDLNLDDFNALTKKFNHFELLFRIRTTEGRLEELNSIYQEMDQQMVYLIEENPFKDSGQAHNYKRIQSVIKEEYLRIANGALDEKYRLLLEKQGYTRKKIPSTAVAFSWFWRNPDMGLREKLNFFDEHIRVYLEMNYYRSIDLDGNYVNNFFVLDAPFFSFFLIELIVRWIIAIRRKQYMAWFLYPIYHWYDVLGLIPLAQFKFFRLFRIYTIYLILQESEFTTVGNDFISRTIKYYSNIVKEEISDMVTVQILTESQEEIKSGSSIEIVTNAVNAHRDQIKRIAIAKLGNLSTERSEELVTELISHILNSKTGILKFIPHMGLREKIIRDTVYAGFFALQKTSSAIANSEDGKVTLEKLIDYILDELVASAKDPDLNELNTNITIELLENVKNQVKVKKWLDTEL